MKKHLVATLVAGTILSTSAFAYGGGGQKSMGFNSKQCPQTNTLKQHHRMGKQNFKAKKQNKNASFMKALRGIDLSNEQQKKIQDLRAKNQKDRLKLSVFFSDKGFDAAGYEKEIKEQREKSIQKRALMIEQVYALLTPQQKEKVVAFLKYHE